MFKYNVNTQKNRLFKPLLSIQIAAILFLIIAHNVRMYDHALTGALYEMLAIPSVAIIVLLPLIALFQWYKEKFTAPSKFLYLLTWSLLSLMGMVILANILLLGS